MRKKFSLLVLAAVLAGAGCASYAVPSPAPPPATPTAFANVGRGLDASRAMDSTEPWWRRFADPELDALVARALAANTDVRVAAARLEAARAVRGLAGWGFAPAGGARGGATRVRTSAAEAGGEARGPRGEIFSAGLEAGWEIDLFGRVRAVAAAATARFEAAEGVLEQVRRVVAAEVVRTYFEARGAGERERLLAARREDQERIIELQRGLVAEGRESADAIDRAAAELASIASAELAAGDRAAQLSHALAVLVGEPPGAWRLPDPSPLGELELAPIALGDPTDLLRRRPDIAAAEAVLRAESAEIAAATAELFPQLSLGGFFGFVAGTGSELGSSASRSWFVGPRLSWGIFDLGRVRARVRFERAETEAALAAWEGAVLRALEEAENAFRAYASAQQALGLRVAQAGHARAAAAAAEARYEEGAAAYLEALLARRDALDAELGRLDAIVGHRVASVSVFRALGGLPPREVRGDRPSA